MDELTFKQEALKTESILPDGLAIDGKTASMLISHINVVLQHCAVIDKLKKHFFYKTPLDTSKYVETQRIFMTTAESRLLHAAMGLLTEAGEFMEAVFPVVTGDKPMDRINLSEEIQDGWWYQQIALDVLGLSPDEMRERNIAKLRVRYPEKFDADKANNRDLDKEREKLEGK